MISMPKSIIDFQEKTGYLLVHTGDDIFELTLLKIFQMPQVLMKIQD